MSRKSGKPLGERKVRARSHVIEDLSRAAVERVFLLRGHSLNRPTADYGTDLVVQTHADDGSLEEGYILVQLKATDGPRLRVDGARRFAVDVRDYNLWSKEIYPVLLVLYDVREEAAYWQYFQAYFAADPARRPKPGRRTVTVAFPRSNLLNEAAVDYIRERKRAVHEQAFREVRHAF